MSGESWAELLGGRDGGRSRRKLRDKREGEEGGERVIQIDTDMKGGIDTRKIYKRGIRIKIYWGRSHAPSL